MNHTKTWKQAQRAFHQQLERNIMELNWNYPTHWHHFIQHIAKIQNYIDRIIDVGCGVGAYYKLCQRSFPHLIYKGYDSAPYAIKLAQQKWQPPEGTFTCLDCKELQPIMFTEFRDVLVANALCDVLPDGNDCAHFLLSLNIPYILLQRVRITDKQSYAFPYTVYSEIDTYEFYHNKTELFQDINDCGYTVTYKEYSPDILDMLLIKNVN